MKADMRAPLEGGTDYLLIVEAETDLEKTALAHFAKQTAHAERELRITLALPTHERGAGGLNFTEKAGAVQSVFIAWDRRVALASDGLGSEKCSADGCAGVRLYGNPLCAVHDQERFANG